MSRLTYRSAMPGDLPFLIGMIVEDSVVSSGDDPADALHDDYIKALATIAADPNQEMIVVELEGEAVGCFQLTYIPGLMRRGSWRGLLEVVHVRADKRNLGLGSEMMRWAIGRCRERNCGLVQLTSNKKRLDAHRFYERLGFQKSHEGFKYYL
jgi:GNAT superfamily N-acetyltransferase